MQKRQCEWVPTINARVNPIAHEKEKEQEVDVLLTGYRNGRPVISSCSLCKGDLRLPEKLMKR